MGQSALPKVSTVAILLFAGLFSTVGNAEVLDGPYFGEVVRIVDGDNFEATVEIWPTISATVSVRIRGVDAPEMFRPKCEPEETAAQEAYIALQELLPLGTKIRLEDVEADSFSGRVLATAFRQSEEEGRTLEKLLLRREVVLPWDGKNPIDWCADVDSQ